MRLSLALLMRAPVTPTRYTVGIGLMGLCAPMIGRRVVRRRHLVVAYVNQGEACPIAA